MSNIIYKPVRIKITYSNGETSRFGVKAGQEYKAVQEYLKGKPQMKCFFRAPGSLYDCIAYVCDHDEDARIPVTTCEIITE